MRNKNFLTIISFALIFSIIFTGCTYKQNVNIDNKEDVKADKSNEELVKNTFVLEKYQGTNIDVPFQKTIFKANVQPYNVKNDLSNIVNLAQFGDFSEEQLDLIIKNNFVVNPTKEEQLFYIYEQNEYLEIPSFITTDSVLHTYHIFYDYYLRTLESEKLLGILVELTDKMLKSSTDFYNVISNEDVKKAQLKNIAFLSTAQLCLKKALPGNIPKEARDMAVKEFELIEAHTGFNQSVIFPFDLDYSQFIPRGHYTRNEDFEIYFKTMMWYGQVPFPLYIERNGVNERNIEQTLQAILLTYSIYSNKEFFHKWENIYQPTNFFVGSADDLGIFEYGDLLFKIYGNNPDLNKLNDKDKLDKFYEEADKLPEPRIKAKYTAVSTPVGKQFRFMGQRYVLDAEIIQEFVKPIVRPIPSGLDVFGVLGSERAKEIQMTKEENKYWEEYPMIFDKLKNSFSDLTDEEWKTNIYQGWLWTLKGFLEPFGKGYPSFMTNDAWVDKDLNTALGSWSELKHDTVLYGKQSGAEKGGGGRLVVGYVEPNIEVYEKLLWLTRFSRENLNVRNLGVESIDEKMIKFENLLEFLINCSVKELNNEQLTEDEYNRIGYYGAILEDLMNSFVEGDARWFEITSETDKNMAVIADFHTVAPNQFSEGGYMEAGVGPAYEIYVVVPIAGELYLTRGGVFSYNEFISTERLTDEKWQDMLKDDKQPPMPEWTNSFIREGKGEIPWPY